MLVNEIADTLGVASLHVSAGAVGESQGPAGVTQERKRKAEFLREGGILWYGVKTHSQNFHVARAELGNLVAEPATFGGSPRGISFGVEP